MEMPTPTLEQLPTELRRNVMLAAEDKDVQRLIVDAMWGCMDRVYTEVSDIIEYLTPEDISNTDTHMALWGEEDENVEQEEEVAVCNNYDAIRVLIQLVKDKALQALKGEPCDT